MIVRQQVRSRMALAPEHLAWARVDVEEFAGRELARAIAREAVRHAVDVDERDVFVWTGEPMLHAETLEAVWAPDPSRGVQLVGGPHDGDVVALPRKEGPGCAYPALRLVLPVRIPDAFCEFTSGVPTATYERDGIDVDGRRFVYRYIP